jgi:hypothetical protein
MKQLLLLFFLAAFHVSYAQWEMGFGYLNQTPTGAMKNDINAANGINFQVGYRLPFAEQRFSAGFDVGTGRYGKKKVTQSFQSDLVTEPTEFPVNYINFANYTHLNLRFEIVNKGNIIPYIQASGGRQSLGTRVRINVHEDQLGGTDCVPLENQVTFKDRNMVWGYGGGILVNLSCWNKQWRKTNGTALNIAVNRIYSGNIDYVNVKRLSQVSAANPVTSEPGAVKPLTMRFANLNSNNIHNHTVAEVYNNPLQQFQVKVALLFTL